MALLWLSLRVRWRGGWARSLALVLLIGCVGGFIVAAAASARRVESTYQNLVDEIGAPDVVVLPGCLRPSPGFGCDAAPEPVSGEDFLARLTQLAVVEQARLVEAQMAYFVDADGQPLFGAPDDPYGCADDDRSVSVVALRSGGATDQAMPFRLDGDLPAAGSSGVVLALATAERGNLGVGDELHVAGWCSDGAPIALPHPIALQVTGLSVGPLDIEPPDTGIAIEPAYVDPFVVDALVSAGAEPQRNSVVWLDQSALSDDARQDLEPFVIVMDLRERAVVFDEALATDARLLWLLAAVGAVGAVLLLGPILARNVRNTGRDTSIVVALGTSRTQVRLQALAQVGVLALVGAFLAAVLALPISVVMPRGFAVAIAPRRAMWFDGRVTIAGFALLVCAVLAMGALAAWRIGRSDPARRARLSTNRGTVVGLSHLRPAVHTGVLTAVGTPAGPRQPSPWPSFVSLVIAGATIVAGFTYLAGLDHLERTPSLMGWNWDATVGIASDAGNLDPTIRNEIEQIDGVEAVTAGPSFPPVFPRIVDTEFEVWPWSFATGPDAITPSMLNGRAPDGPDEVAVNTVFADETGLGVGDTVTFSRPAMVSVLADEFERWAEESGFEHSALDEPDEPPVVATFEITGLAVLPLQRTEALAQASFTLAGYAAFVEPDEDEVALAASWLPTDLPIEAQAEATRFLSDTDIENRGLYVRFSGDLQATADAIGRIEGVEQVVAPTAEQVLTIVIGLNLSHNHRVPAALVYVVSIAAAALLIYLLVTTVRARRFEFAVLRALGLSTKGVRWSIAAEATATAIIPLLVAIPLGVAVGRQAWLAYARDLEVVPVSVTPWPALAILVAASIVLANLVVLVPGRSAAARSPDTDLRAG